MYWSNVEFSQVCINIFAILLLHSNMYCFIICTIEYKLLELMSMVCTTAKYVDMPWTYV